MYHCKLYPYGNIVTKDPIKLMKKYGSISRVNRLNGSIHIHSKGKVPPTFFEGRNFSKKKLEEIKNNDGVTYNQSYMWVPCYNM